MAFGAAMAAVLVCAYALFESMFHGSTYTIAAVQECTPGTPTAAANPNKLLFVSCGGFLN